MAARWAALDVVAVFGVALALRLGMVLYSHGGMWGNFGYDGSVYYAAADALTFGRMPYQDFVLLHPPGLMLVLVPFALLGRLVGDHAGFVAATCACEVLGAINAVLVVLVSRRAGAGTPGGAARAACSTRCGRAP